MSVIKRLFNNNQTAPEYSPNEMYQLGFAYEMGDAFAQDYTQAFNWFIKAAEQGHHKAQAFLNNILETNK